jgi:hypothetical protein
VRFSVSPPLSMRKGKTMIDMKAVMTRVNARMVSMHKWDCVCVGCEDARKRYQAMLEAVAEPIVERDARIAQLERELAEATKDARRYAVLRNSVLSAPMSAGMTMLTTADDIDSQCDQIDAASKPAAPTVDDATTHNQD